jgi:hypothetical protein
VRIKGSKKINSIEADHGRQVCGEEKFGTITEKIARNGSHVQKPIEW